VWAEQGDEISLEYAGTNALKGDLVRYEKFYNESSVFMFPSVILMNFGFMMQIRKKDTIWIN